MFDSKPTRQHTCPNLGLLFAVEVYQQWWCACLTDRHTKWFSNVCNANALSKQHTVIKWNSYILYRDSFQLVMCPSCEMSRWPVSISYSPSSVPFAVACQSHVTSISSLSMRVSFTLSTDSVQSAGWFQCITHTLTDFCLLVENHWKDMDPTHTQTWSDKTLVNSFRTRVA